MRVVRRAVLGVIGRTKKNVLILMAISTVMILVLSSIAVKNAVKTASSNAKSAIRPTVDIAADVQKTIYTSGTMETIYESLAEDLEVLDHVEDVVPKLKVASHCDYNQVPVEGVIIGSWGRGAGSKYQADPTNWIQGMDDPGKAVKFGTGENQIVKGVYPIDSCEENPIIISEDFAAANNLQVGDRMTIGVGETITEPMDFTICGIFEIVIASESMMPTTIDDQRNVFYTTYETARRAWMLNSPEAVIAYASIRVILDETENIDGFITEVKERIKDVTWDNYRFTSGIDTYKKVTAAVDDVGGFSSIILWLSGLSAVGILTLLMILSLRGRRYEIGVLLSLGESKAGIVAQMTMEVVVIAVVASLISLGISSLIVKDIGDSMLAHAAVTVKEEDPSPYNFTPGQGKSISIQLGEEVDEFIQPINEFEIELLSVETFLQSMLYGLAVIVLSTALPGIVIMRRQAKAMMLRH